MDFLSITPSPALRGFVRDYLFAHFVFDPAQPIPHKRYAPRPEQGITFFARGRPTIVDPLTGDVQVAPSAAIFGQQMKRCDVHLAPEFLMLRVHFQPGALFRLLNIPLYEFGEQYFDAELVLGREVREVSEKLSAARDRLDMISAVETYLLRLGGRAEQKILPVDRAAARLTADPLHTSREFLARESCLSPRQFTRKFTERMGVGPKLYGRLVRFQRAHQFKVAHPDLAWTAVAIRFGYTDYQHMVRDFRQFTNAAPNQWLQEDSASPEHPLSHPGLG